MARPMKINTLFITGIIVHLILSNIVRFKYVISTAQFGEQELTIIGNIYGNNQRLNIFFIIFSLDVISIGRIVHCLFPSSVYLFWCNKYLNVEIIVFRQLFKLKNVGIKRIKQKFIISIFFSQPNWFSNNSQSWNAYNIVYNILNVFFSKIR